MWSSARSRHVPGSGHANPGRAGRGTQGGPSGKGWGASLEAWLRIRRVCPLGGPGHQPGDTCPQGDVGVLTSRAQHLEQLEVLHAHLLLVPGQVGCGHRRRMSPAGACPLPGRPGGPHPAPRPLATPRPTFGDPQLHGAALVLVLVPHGVRVAGGAPRGSAPGGAGYMAAPAGAGASWCRLRGPRRAPAPPPAPRPARPESGGWNVTAPGGRGAGGGGPAPSGARGGRQSSALRDRGRPSWGLGNTLCEPRLGSGETLEPLLGGRSQARCLPPGVPAEAETPGPCPKGVGWGGGGGHPGPFEPPPPGDRSSGSQAILSSS